MVSTNALPLVSCRRHGSTQHGDAIDISSSADCAARQQVDISAASSSVPPASDASPTAGLQLCRHLWPGATTAAPRLVHATRLLSTAAALDSIGREHATATSGTASGRRSAAAIGAASANTAPLPAPAGGWKRQRQRTQTSSRQRPRSDVSRTPVSQHTAQRRGHVHRHEGSRQRRRTPAMHAGNQVADAPAAPRSAPEDAAQQRFMQRVGTLAAQGASRIDRATNTICPSLSVVKHVTAAS